MAAVFKGYLGEDQAAWAAYDATEIVKKDGYPSKSPILIDVGTTDKFLDSQLRPQLFLEAAKGSGVEVCFRYH